MISLCCNELDYTRRCLESVFRHTRPPYELVLVDNGSTDGTPAYLEEIRAQPGPQRVDVIRNDTNAGFPRGCNQALAQARGRWLVFLNNDTLVTPGWLDGLVAWAQHHWPHTGLVGPVTNYASPPQQILVPYTDVPGLDAFAAECRQSCAGQALRVPRLSGFCLLARREVLERLGGFDEQYGVGFFEDDDLGWRVQDAGFQLLLALGVFVHHFGSRTFAGLGLDTTAQLQANFERFRAKWGPERSSGYRLPGAGDERGARLEEGDLPRLLDTHEEQHFASVDTGLRGYKARHNLAVLYLEQGRLVEAERQWQAALGERPDFGAAWLGLGDVYLTQRRWEQVEQVAQRLAADPSSTVEAAVLRARAHQGRQEFGAARQLLEATCDQHVRALWPRVILSHVLLQEGRDWAAAEQVLRAVLALDPGHREARHNLTLLLRQQTAAGAN